MTTRAMLTFEQAEAMCGGPKEWASFRAWVPIFGGFQRDLLYAREEGVGRVYASEFAQLYLRWLSAPESETRLPWGNLVVAIEDGDEVACHREHEPPPALPDAVDELVGVVVSDYYEGQEMPDGGPDVVYACVYLPTYHRDGVAYRYRLLKRTVWESRDQPEAVVLPPGVEARMAEASLRLVDSVDDLPPPPSARRPEVRLHPRTKPRSGGVQLPERPSRCPWCLSTRVDVMSVDHGYRVGCADCCATGPEKSSALDAKVAWEAGPAAR